MTDANVKKIECGHCEKWLARVELGVLYVRCPRCGEYEQVVVGDLLQELIVAADRVLRGRSPQGPPHNPPRPKKFFG